MKYRVTFFLMSFVFLFTVACGKSNKCVETSNYSVSHDMRCMKIRYDAYDKGTETGVCYRGPLIQGIHDGAIDPDPEACKALYVEAQKKCDALPPDPNSLKTVSGTRVYKDGELVSVNGEPVSKGLPDCDECKDCEPID